MTVQSMLRNRGMLLEAQCVCVRDERVRKGGQRDKLGPDHQPLKCHPVRFKLNYVKNARSSTVF